MEEITCYICLDTHNKKRNQLISGCSNTKCSARVHQKCINKRIKSKKSKHTIKCDYCTNKMNVKRERVTNYGKCCKSVCGSIWGHIYVIFYWVYVIILMPILALGHSAVKPDHGWLMFLTYITPLIFGFVLQWPLNCGDGCGCWRYEFSCTKFPYQCFKGTSMCGCSCGKGCCLIEYDENYKLPAKRTFTTIMVLMMIEAGVIMAAHGIGASIVKKMYGIDSFFTWRSGLAGMIVVYIVLVFIFVILSIMGCVGCCLKHYKEERIVIISKV